MIIGHIRFVPSRHPPFLYCFINKDIYWLRLYLDKTFDANPTVTDSDDLEKSSSFLALSSKNRNK